MFTFALFFTNKSQMSKQPYCAATESKVLPYSSLTSTPRMLRRMNSETELDWPRSIAKKTLAISFLSFSLTRSFCCSSLFSWFSAFFF